MRNPSFHFAVRSPRVIEADFQQWCLPTDRKVHDADVFRFTGTCRHHRQNIVRPACIERGARFADGAGLIRFDQCGIDEPEFYRLFDACCVRYDEIITDDATVRAYCAQFRPKLRVMFAILLRTRIFDEQHRIARAPVRQTCDPLRRMIRRGVCAQVVIVMPVELVRGDVERDGHVVEWFETGLFDRSREQLERRFIAGDIGPEAAFVGNAAQLTGRRQDFAERVINPRTPVECRAPVRNADRQRHDVLQIDATLRVGAAADDLNLRQRHRKLVSGCEVTSTAGPRLRPPPFATTQTTLQ